MIWGDEEAAGGLWGRSSLPPGEALCRWHLAGSLGKLPSRTIAGCRRGLLPALSTQTRSFVRTLKGGQERTSDATPL